MSGYKLQADISHWNSSFTASQYDDDRIGLKATDGEGGTDSTYKARVADAHKHGIAVEHYAFCENGDPKEEASFFVSVVKPHWLINDRFALDAEVAGVDGKFVKRFAAQMRKLQPHWQGMLYGSPSFLASNHIEVPEGWLVWIADVTDAAEPTMPEGYPAWSLWQFTFSESVRGIGGKCDVSRVAHEPKPAKKPHGMNPILSAAVTVVNRLAAPKAADRPYTVKAKRRLTLASKKADEWAKFT